MPTTQCQTSKHFAKVLQLALQERNIDLPHCFPYNRRTQYSDLYWLSSSTSNPNYAHAKIAISKSTEQNKFHVGLHIERGYADGWPDKKEVMTDSWDWHLLLQKINDSAFSSLISKVEKLSGTLSLGIHPQIRNLPTNFGFKLNSPSIALQSPIKRSHPWHPLNSVQHTKELFEQIETIASKERFWVNVWMMFPVEIDSTSEQLDQETIDTIVTMAHLMQM
jgi:hypothetical protein